MKGLFWSAVRIWLNSTCPSFLCGQDCVSDLICLSQLMRNVGRECGMRCPVSSQAGGQDMRLSSNVHSGTQISTAAPLQIEGWELHFLNFCQFPVEPTWHHSDATGTGVVIPLTPYTAAVVHGFHLLHILLPVGWEVQNRIPSGTILKAFISGGENGPWMKFMRGEMTIEAFLQEFGRLCSETVSEKHTWISIILLA